MKRIAVLLLVASVMAYAQKPVAGDVLTELEFMPNQLGLFTAGNGRPYGLINNQLRVRYFLQDNFAARLMIGIQRASQKEDVYENVLDKDTAGVGTITRKATQFSINIGAEKHTPGAEKLSTYVGGTIGFAIRSAKEEWNKVDVNGNYNDSTNVMIEGQANINNTLYTKGTTFNIYLFGGADYYFLPNVFFGIELGLNIALQTTRESVRTVTVSGRTQSNTIITPGTKGTDILTNALALIKIGFNFGTGGGSAAQ